MEEGKEMLLLVVFYSDFFFFLRVVCIHRHKRWPKVSAVYNESGVSGKRCYKVQATNADSDLGKHEDLAKKLPGANPHLWEAQLGRCLISKAIGNKQTNETKTQTITAVKRAQMLVAVYCVSSAQL